MCHKMSCNHSVEKSCILRENEPVYNTQLFSGEGPPPHLPTTTPPPFPSVLPICCNWRNKQVQNSHIRKTYFIRKLPTLRCLFNLFLDPHLLILSHLPYKRGSRNFPPGGGGEGEAYNSEKFEKEKQNQMNEWINSWINKYINK